jgi:hypothetical protein
MPQTDFSKPVIELTENCQNMEADSTSSLRTAPLEQVNTVVTRERRLCTGCVTEVIILRNFLLPQ